MKKNKSFILSIIVCLLPIALGIILYEKLPNDMPMHFSTANGVDNYANKNFVIFGLPILMAFVQTILMIVMKKANRETSTVIKILKWLIPVLTIILYILAIMVSFNGSKYVSKIICLILGILFIVIGNYMPKMNYDTGKLVFHPIPKDEKAFILMSKIMRYSFVIIGTILFILMIWV